MFVRLFEYLVKGTNVLSLNFIITVYNAKVFVMASVWNVQTERRLGSVYLGCIL